MKLIKMECPYCGAPLEIPEGEKTAKCSYCGKTIEVDPENENVITIKDEAKLKEAELKEKQYQDQKAEKEKNERKDFRKSKTGKLIIVLIIIVLLAALSAIMRGKVLAGIVALIQIALLTASMMIGTGSIEKIRGKRIPYLVFLIIACVLCIPYIKTSGGTSSVKKDKEELVWPSTELAKRIPEPDSKYGDVSISDEEKLYVDVEDFTEKKYQAYVEQCKKKGFTVDSSASTNSYEAADKDGYVLSLDFYEDSMSINLDAAPDYTEFTWPVSTLASVLPEPPVNRGKVTIDTSTDFSMLIPDMDKTKFKDYANAALNAGFNIDYENNDTYFEGKNADGIEVSLSKRTGNVMNIDLESPAEEEEETAPEPTTEATTAPAATAATGVRPEFKEAMDSYKATIDAYCEFMKSYDSSNVEMLAKYTKLYAQYMDTMSKLDAIDEQELSNEEDAYYLQTMSEINQELIETGQSLS